MWVDFWINRTPSSPWTLALCVCLPPKAVNDGDTPSSGMTLRRFSHYKSLWRLNNTFMSGMAIGTKCRSLSAGSLDWDRSSVCCPLIQQIRGLLVRNKIEMFCVSLSMKARAVIQYIYLPCERICAALCHPVPWGHPVTCCIALILWHSFQ